MPSCAAHHIPHTTQDTHARYTTQQHSNTATQQHSNTATQQHSNTATQQHSNTATPHRTTPHHTTHNTAIQQHNTTRHDTTRHDTKHDTTQEGTTRIGACGFTLLDTGRLSMSRHIKDSQIYSFFLGYVCCSALPLLVVGVFCLGISVSERDFCLLNSVECYYCSITSQSDFVCLTQGSLVKNISVSVFIFQVC